LIYRNHIVSEMFLTWMASSPGQGKSNREKLGHMVKLRVMNEPAARKENRHAMEDLGPGAAHVHGIPRMTVSETHTLVDENQSGQLFREQERITVALRSSAI
jgi:hypothetical protein